MTAIVSINARTGEGIEVAQETSTTEVDRLCALALEAAPVLAERGREFRAGLLRAMAEALEARRTEIVATADRETAIGETRLSGELTRTCYQAGVFADMLVEGSYVEAIIDPAGNTPMGPRPDLRRMLVPLGPVAVFGASNFPLAFSVPGGDTVSALAAGCPVIIKSHGSHPATSTLCFEIMLAAAKAAGAPDGTLGLVHGLQAGADLVAHPAVTAVGFTGSLTGGRALLEIIHRRSDPIPFYGEMSSLNPVVVTRGAARDRATEIGEGLVSSFTTAGGQLCTKPGLVLVPAGDAGDLLVSTMIDSLRNANAQVPLNVGIGSTYDETTTRLRASDVVQTLVTASAADTRGMMPLLLAIDAPDLGEETTQECFGPVTLVARYDGDAELDQALDAIPSSLTATLHVADDEVTVVEALTPRLQRKAGRLVYNGYPTGVAVSWAQHHGGPWPSTNSVHTSVGTSAVRRFLRPVTWQDAPPAALPEELRDGNTRIPRRVGGVLVTPSSSLPG